MTAATSAVRRGTMHTTVTATAAAGEADLALIHTLAGGGILAPAHAAEAGAGGRGLSLLDALALARPGSPGLVLPGDPDQDPDPTLALLLIQGAGPAQLGDLGLVQQLGAVPKLELHFKNKVVLPLEVQAEAKARNEMTEALTVFLFNLLSCLSLLFLEHLNLGMEGFCFVLFSVCLRNLHNQCLLQYQGGKESVELCVALYSSS